jgi:hypothetical protein
LSGVIDESRASADDSETAFKDFFARPVRIGQWKWTPRANALSELISPWTEWMNDPRIANRISNFRNFRGTLKVKFLINGNAFYWGLAMASYFPGGGNPENSDFNFTDVRMRGDICKATQRMHVLLDPTTNQGGTLSLPFFWYKDAFDLTQDDPNLLGEIWLVQVTQLLHPNVTTPIDITAYAWCEDAVLSSPTQVNYTQLSAQAGEVNDEYANGPISQPAAKFAAASSLFKGIPLIGKWAYASELGASAIAKIASSFGYCRPRVVTDTTRMNINQGLELATVDAQDTSYSLGFTAKRELTLDPMVTGAGPADEMAFSTIAARPGLLATVAWTQQGAVDGIVLTMPVTPYQYIVENRILPPINDVVTFLPCTFVAHPFDFWKGVMRVRVQIIASAFHKGRLMLSWDPRQTTQGPQSQVVRSHIIDIAEERDCTFDIGWGCPYPALVGTGSTPPTASTYTIYANSTQSFNAHNGGLQISIINKLTSSVESDDGVSVLVWVSFPELEVFGPDADNINNYTPWQVSPNRDADDTLVAQAGAVETGDITADEPGKPVEEAPCHTMGEAPKMESSMFMHGDPVDNFRTVLKRYCLAEVMAFDFNPENKPYKYSEYRRQTYPYYRGVQPTVPEWKGPLTIRAYVSQSYLGWRGGIRQKLIPMQTEFPFNYIVSRMPQGNQGYFEGFYDNIEDVAYFQDESWSGSMHVNDNCSQVAEFELPYYSFGRYQDCTIYQDKQSRQSSFRVSVFSDAPGFGHLFRYEAVADDFNMFMFIGAPQMVFAPRTPT